MVVEVWPPGSDRPVFRRLAHSRSVYDGDPRAAAVNAARDAFRVLEGHLAEALKPPASK
jgi:hypothetical protein